MLVNPPFDGPLAQLRHDIVAVFLSDAHEHVSPVFHGDPVRIRMSDKVLSITVQQQELANPVLVVSGTILEALDLLQRCIAIQKHLHDPGTDR